MYFDEALLTSPKQARNSPRKVLSKQVIGSGNTTPKKHGCPPSPQHLGSSSPVRSQSSSSSSSSGSIQHHVKADIKSEKPLSSASVSAALSPSVLSKSSCAGGSSSSSSGSSHQRQSRTRQQHTIELDHRTVVQPDLEPPNMMQLKIECSSSKNGTSANKETVPSRATPIKLSSTNVSSDGIADRATVHYNGVRLRNFLKLPQAHKWIYYEWFYANIDQPLFLGRNDFEQVLSENFPQIKTKKVTRRQWSLVRRIMGKPRRCSQAFFNEEISSLSKRRKMLRLLQQRKISDVSQFRDLPFALPLHIPCQLVIGTKVTARIRKPENGLYMGRIDAVDTSNNTYRVTFVRNGIGTHSIPDYEVLSCEVPEMMPLASFQQNFRPRPPLGLVTPPRPLLPRHSADTPSKSHLLGLDSPSSYITNDPVLAQSPRQPPPALGMGDHIGQYPVESLMHIVRLWKLLENKAEKVKQLENLNTGAEKLRCTGEEVSSSFQRRYATLVIDVDNLNDQLNHELLEVHTFCQDISGGSCSATAPRLLPRQIEERCMAEAVAVVQVSNSSAPEPVTDPHALHLVTSLTALMLQIKNLGDNEVSAFELSSLQSAINNLRDEVDDKETFRDLVEVPLTHIMAAASQLGPLNAFTSSSKE